jgi:hypothetical protein
MQKVAVLYREPLRPELPAEGWCARVSESIAPACHAVTLLLRNRDLPTEFLAAGGLDTTIGAVLVLWIGRSEVLPDLDRHLDWPGGQRCAYVLLESVIREYERIDWPLGTRSPGATLFALLRKRAGLSEREFRERWERHSTLSVRLHPLTRYHRNVVVRTLGADGDDCDGVVEERIGTLDDLAPERFYIGAGAREEATRSLDSYVNLASGGLTCALMDEYLIKLPPWLRAAQRMEHSHG